MTRWHGDTIIVANIWQKLPTIVKSCQNLPSSLPDPPPSNFQGEGGWPPEGEEGAGADRGGRVSHNHLLPEEDPVRGGSQGPSKALAGQVGGDRPGSSSGCRTAQLCSQP